MNLGVCCMGQSEQHGTDLLGFVTDQLCSLLTILVLLEHHPSVCNIAIIILNGVNSMFTRMENSYCHILVIVMVWVWLSGQNTH